MFPPYRIAIVAWRLVLKHKSFHVETVIVLKLKGKCMNINYPSSSLKGGKTDGHLCFLFWALNQIAREFICGHAALRNDG